MTICDHIVRQAPRSGHATINHELVQFRGDTRRVSVVALLRDFDSVAQEEEQWMPMVAPAGHVMADFEHLLQEDPRGIDPPLEQAAWEEGRAIVDAFYGARIRGPGLLAPTLDVAPDGGLLMEWYQEDGMMALHIHPSGAPKYISLRRRDGTRYDEPLTGGLPSWAISFLRE